MASDTEDIINMTLMVGGTEVAVIFVEMKRRRGIKVSFRSRGTLDCSRMSEQFGGGGHKAAAGATLVEPFDSALAKVLCAVRAAMQEWSLMFKEHDEWSAASASAHELDAAGMKMIAAWLSRSIRRANFGFGYG